MMNHAIRQFQKMLYPCVEITADDMYKYPPLDEYCFGIMKEEYLQNRENIIAFVFPRYDLTGVKYVDTYIWNLVGEEECERFIIQKNTRMEEKKEIIFDSYCKNSGLCFSMECKDAILRICKNYYPEIHMNSEYKNPGQMLAHLYWSLHRSGPREILFKANLYHFAMQLDEGLGDYNMLGTSPSSVLYNMPLPLLQIMNSEVGVLLLRSQKRRKQVIKLYQQYGNYILNLLELYRNGETVNASKYKQLDYAHDKREYLLCKKYEKIFEEVKPWMELDRYPRMWEMDEALFQATRVKRYLEEREAYDERMREIYYGMAQELEYVDDVYCVKAPKSALEIFEEARNQHSCLARYVEDVMEGECIILFMRKTANPNASLITIEIRGDIIFQALGTCNRKLEQKEEEWLEKYAKKKKLVTELEIPFE